MRLQFPVYFEAILRSWKYVVRKKLYFTIPLAALTLMNWINVFKIKGMEGELEEKTTLVNEVMVKMVINNYDINDIPLPMGFKIYDTDENIIWGAVVNNAYQLKYGFGTSNYFGQSDINMDTENGREWMQNDLMVLDSNEMQVHIFNENSTKGKSDWYKWWKNKSTSIDVRYVRLYFMEKK